MIRMSWEERGGWLRNKPLAPKPSQEITSLSDEALIEKKQTAEDWLRDRYDHPKYAQALDRYEKICDELEVRRVKSYLI